MRRFFRCDHTIEKLVDIELFFRWRGKQLKGRETRNQAFNSSALALNNINHRGLVIARCARKQLRRPRNSGERVFDFMPQNTAKGSNASGIIVYNLVLCRFDHADDQPAIFNRAEAEIQNPLLSQGWAINRYGMGGDIAAKFQCFIDETKDR